MKELQKVSSSLKNKKSSAFDSISNEMIKCSIGHLGELLLRLFNTVINKSEFPKQWSEGYIIPIFKSGDILDPTNYRGITVSSCLGKLFTKILNTRLLNYLLDNKMISNSQIGFIPGNRTSDHILLVKTLIDSYKKLKKKLFICFIDFRKAFDTIYRTGLIYKLMQLKVSSKFIHIVQAMYSNITASVKTKEGLTTTFPIQVGTRQGCNLSPTLFNLYINDLPKEFDDTCKPITLHQTRLSCLMYADDLVIFSETENGMKKCLAKLECFCSKWRLSVNTTKSKILIINQPKRHDISFRLFKNKLEIVNSYKYLGIIIDKTTNFKSATEELGKKATRAYYAIKKHFNFNNNTATKTAIKLFESMVQPILLYGCEIWGMFGWRRNDIASIKHFLFNNKHKFEHLHIKMCKNTLGINKHASDIMATAELGRYPLLSNIIKYTYSYWQHILNSKTNSLLHQTLMHMKKQHSNGNTNFFSRFHSLLSALGKPELILQCKTSQIHDKSNDLRKAYCSKYEKHFFNTLQEKGGGTGSGGKFEIYYAIKKVFKFETYLNMKSNILRRCLTNIRISTHCLPVEKLRKFNIARQDRICNLCNDNVVGTEMHVLVNCQNRDLQLFRKTLYDNILLYSPQFESLKDEDKFRYLLNCIDNDCNFYFAVFLEKVYRLVCKKKN